jgi:steroid delta-isomerase-like uncharacterized protein
VRVAAPLSQDHDESARTLVRSYFEQVLRAGRIEELDTLLAPCFRSHSASGATVDRDGYRAAVAATLAAFTDLEVELHDQIAEAGRIATRWSVTGTHSGIFAGLAATGRRVTVSGVHIHRIAHGQIIEHWEVLDLHGLLAQLQR